MTQAVLHPTLRCNVTLGFKSVERALGLDGMSVELQPRMLDRRPLCPQALAPLLLMLAACSTPKTPPEPEGPMALPPLAAAKLTVDQLLLPQHAFENPPDTRDSEDPSVLVSMLAEGFGAYTVSTYGEPRMVRTPGDVATPPAPGPNARRLVHFVHLTDIQLADDESPTRLATFDSPGILDSAFRPQEADMCRMLNAAVRTVNAIHAADPLDFVLTGGDIIDSAQSNELDWAMAILDGAPSVKCDSGRDDDPVPGPNNDGKDPFVPVGLDVPWYWVTGNHDVCVQGNFVVDDTLSAQAIGDQAIGGTRDWSRPGGPIVTGTVPADPRRKLMRRADLMAKIAADRDGHGVGKDQLARGKAFYTFDVPNTPLRFLVLDTSAETGGSGGLLRRADLDQLIRPALAQATTDHKWIVLASHHALSSLGDGSDYGGTTQSDAVSADEVAALFSATPGVIFDIVGHSHVHRVDLVGPASRQWWEVLTSALADHPHQMRVIEIWDQDNGFAMLRATNIDFATDADPVAEEGRRLGLVDRVSGWWGKGTGQISDRNVELWIRTP
jgi:3',5'-cyclic AMP phosphodiesterase CpdA